MINEDRRVYRRIDDSLQIKFAPADKKWSSIPYDTTYTKNISRGGFLFYSNAVINVDEVIDLKFFIKGKKEFVQALAKVVRIKEISQNKMYEIGIQFLNIEEQDAKLILQYVSESASDE